MGWAHLRQVVLFLPWCIMATTGTTTKPATESPSATPEAPRQSDDSSSESKIISFLLRRKFVVDRVLQKNFLIHDLGATVVMMVALGVGLFLPLFRALAGAGAGSQQAENWSYAMTYLHGCFWPLVALCLLIATLKSVWQSHRVAGPLVQVKKQVGRIIAGKLPAKVVTRKHDYLKNEVDLLNEMSRTLNERIDRLDAAGKEISDALSRSEALVEKSGNQETKDAIALAKIASEELDDAIRAFGTTQPAS